VPFDHQNSTFHWYIAGQHELVISSACMIIYHTRALFDIDLSWFNFSESGADDSLVAYFTAHQRLSYSSSL